MKDAVRDMMEGGFDVGSRTRRVESDPDQKLVYWDPHNRHDVGTFLGKEQTIFKRNSAGGEQRPEELRWDYSDRLREYDREKHEAAWEKTMASGVKPKSAHFVEEYLTAYYEKPVRLWEVGVTLLPSGWPVRSYGYVFKE